MNLYKQDGGQDCRGCGCADYQRARSQSIVFQKYCFPFLRIKFKMPFNSNLNGNEFIWLLLCLSRHLLIQASSTTTSWPPVESCDAGISIAYQSLLLNIRHRTSNNIRFVKLISASLSISKCPFYFVFT